MGGETEEGSPRGMEMQAPPTDMRVHTGPEPERLSTHDQAELCMHQHTYVML
jgi:hypothetical protein